MKYNPKQYPQLLDETFSKYYSYQEYHIKDIEDFAVCIWSMNSKNPGSEPVFNNILPDACTDIIFDFTTHEIYFAGFSKETKPFPLFGQIDYMGVRLRPSACYSYFSIKATKIMDQTYPIFQTTLEKIWEKKTIKKRIEWITKELKKQREISFDPQFIYFVNQLYENPNEQTVENLAIHFGYNKRHLYRLFQKNYGVSPKVLLNILRLHFSLELLLEKKKTLTEIAHICGFYDQSHFVKEIKKYTNISPIQLVEKITTMSDFYKK